MIVGVGCDIVEIERIAKNYLKIASKILTKKEQLLLQGLSEKRQIEFIAGRFAAKEAIYKAHNDFRLIKNIEILNDGSGKPVIFLAGFKIHISISHEKKYVMAIAVCEREC